MLPHLHSKICYVILSRVYSALINLSGLTVSSCSCSLKRVFGFIGERADHLVCHRSVGNDTPGG